MPTGDRLRPVFLIGAGRSGTKFVRSLLAASDAVAAVPYDVGYVWRIQNESVAHDEFSADMVTPSIANYVRKTLPKLADYEGKHRPRYLLEKSVPNSLRPEFLYKIFPDAIFIHLIRDGRAVTESSIRVWQEEPDRGYLLKKLRYFPWSNYRYAFWYVGNMIKGRLFSNRGQNIWGPRYKGIQDDVARQSLTLVCARQWRKCVEVSGEQLAKIPSAQVFEMRYEDLMAGPEKMQVLCSFLGLPDAECVMEAFKKDLQSSNKDKWQQHLDAEQLKVINSEIGSVLSKYNYC